LLAGAVDAAGSLVATTGTGSDLIFTVVMIRSSLSKTCKWSTGLVVPGAVVDTVVSEKGRPKAARRTTIRRKTA